MKFTLAAAIALFSCLFSLMAADKIGGGTPAVDEKALIQRYAENLTAEVHKMKDANLSPVIAGDVYEGKVLFKDKYDSSSEKYVIIKGANNTVYLPDLTSVRDEVDLSDIAPLIQPAFRLNEEKDAVIMTSALKSLFKHRYEEQYDYRFVQKETTWHFVTGTFFKHLTGFEVKTSPSGEITSIKFKLKLDELPQ